MSNEIIDVEFKPKTPALKKVLPFILTVLVVIIDQITKFIVELKLPFRLNEDGSIFRTSTGRIPSVDGPSYFNDFLQFLHVANDGAAFSLGDGQAPVSKILTLIVVPLVVLILVTVVYFRNKSFTQLQRWSIAGIIGGGVGNIIDRIFRFFDGGVVDFISVKFFRIPYISESGRWPTFNVADMAVVICGILLIISFLITIKNDVKGKNND